MPSDCSRVFCCFPVCLGTQRHLAILTSCTKLCESRPWSRREASHEQLEDLEHQQCKAAGPLTPDLSWISSKFTVPKAATLRSCAIDPGLQHRK